MPSSPYPSGQPQRMPRACLGDNVSMSAFALLRHSHDLARVVLAGFLLTLTCAIAAPLVNPQSTILVCTASGDVKLVAVGDEAPLPVHHSLDCVMCLAFSAPPPQHVVLLAARSDAVAIVEQTASRLLAHSIATPPARGPPAVS